MISDAALGLTQLLLFLFFILLGFPAEMAQATSISHHVFTQVYGYLLGLIGAAWLLLLPRARPHLPTPPAP